MHYSLKLNNHVHWIRWSDNDWIPVTWWGSTREVTALWLGSIFARTIPKERCLSSLYWEEGGTNPGSKGVKRWRWLQTGMYDKRLKCWAQNGNTKKPFGQKGVDNPLPKQLHLHNLIYSLEQLRPVLRWPYFLSIPSQHLHWENEAALVD